MRVPSNTVVSTFMICVNELADLKCNNRKVLSDLVILVSPYAPHVSEELWHLLGNTESVTKAAYPEYKAEYTIENTFEYPVSFNGKMRFKLTMAKDADLKSIEAAVLTAPEAQKWLEGKVPKKVIIVPNKIINVVI